MGYIIGIAIVIGIIYGIIKLLIFIAPYVATGIAFILVAGAVVGLFVGIIYGIKNYTSSILKNINHGALKFMMMMITIVFLVAFFGSLLYFASSSRVVGNSVARLSSMFGRSPRASVVAVSDEIFVDRIVIPDGLNVREGPSVETGVKFVVYRDQVVKVSNKDKSGDWVKIVYDGNEGFVNQTFLREAK